MQLLNIIPTNKMNKGYLLGTIGLVFFILFLFVGFKYGSYHPNPNSEVVQTLLQDLLIKEKEYYEQLINEKDQQILVIQDKLNKSELLIENYKQELKKLNNLVINIKPPSSVGEVRERLRRLGYETY